LIENVYHGGGDHPMIIVEDDVKVNKKHDNFLNQHIFNK